MSMLTPIGMGGHHPGRARRRRPSPVVLAVVVVLLAAVAGGGWWFLVRDPGAPARAVPTCPPVTPSAVALLAPRQVTLNVYNATDRFGLAASVAKRMTQLGYAVKKVDNDPLERSIAGTAEIRHGTAGLAPARTVLAVSPGAVLVPDDRKDRTVDLVLGEKWKALAKKPVAPVVTPSPKPGCEKPSAGTGATAEAARR